MSTGWITDIHLCFLTSDNRKKYYEKLKSLKLKDLIISGDIGEASVTPLLLKEMSSNLNIPIYFVLGNHDFYRSHSKLVRLEIMEFCAKNDTCKYLTKSDPIELKDKVYLVGADCWADGRNGDYKNTWVVLNDSRCIGDLMYQSKPELLKSMRKLADADVRGLKSKIINLLKEKYVDHLVIASHIPPFPENALYRGKPTDKDFLPFYTCKQLGNLIKFLSKTYPNLKITSLSGHTHADAIYKLNDKVTCMTLGSEYYKPPLPKILNL